MSVGGKQPRHRPEAARGPHLRYLCRDQDEIYELYDDVGPTDHSGPSGEGRGLWVVGPSPQPDPPPRHLGTIHRQGIVCRAAGVKPSDHPSPRQH